MKSDALYVGEDTEWCGADWEADTLPSPNFILLENSRHYAILC